MFTGCCCCVDEIENPEFAGPTTFGEERTKWGSLEGAHFQERNSVTEQEAHTTLEDTGGYMFAAALSRAAADEKLGLQGDFADEKVIHICRVFAETTSAVGRYNASAPEERRIKDGDYLVEVNGISHDTVKPPSKVSEALRSELLTADFVKLKVCRPHLFESKVVRNGRPMGLELTYSSFGSSLVIANISEGAVASAVPEIRSGDRIMGIDDLVGSPEKILEVLYDPGDSVLLKLSRPFAP